MPGALTHTRITWALSPMAPQVPGVTPGSPLCPWCCGHSSWRGAQYSPPPNEIDALINYICSWHTNYEVAILFWCGIVLPLGCYPTMHFKFWQSPKGVVLRWSISNLGVLFQGPKLH